MASVNVHCPRCQS
ncbi:hypothetical protein DBW29_23925, partial [Salmonella enterica subsp. enterica]